MSINCKRSWHGAALVAIGLGTSWSAAVAATYSVVYPTGQFPADVANVQAALDGGGTVLLKAVDAQGNPAVFNFGPHDPTGGGVNLNTDVAMTGENIGGHPTTISGGFIPVLGTMPVKSRIADVEFDSPLGAAIILIASSGTEIAGNRIESVIGVRVRVASGFEFTDADGIDLFGIDAPPGAFSGHMDITGNTIENLDADFSNGMQLDGVGADVAITGNTIIYPQSNGFVQTIGITAIRGHGRTTISGNHVSMGPGSPDAFPAAMILAGEHDEHYVVTGNVVASIHPNADGIIIEGGDFSEPTIGASVADNQITIVQQVDEPAPIGGAGVSLYGAVEKAVVSANIIKGHSEFALQIAEGFNPSVSANNRLLGNDVSGHSAVVANVLFATNTQGSLLAGVCSTYMDLGVGNRATCGTAVSLAARPEAARVEHTKALAAQGIAAGAAARKLVALRRQR